MTILKGRAPRGLFVHAAVLVPGGILRQDCAAAHRSSPPLNQVDDSAPITCNKCKTKHPAEAIEQGTCMHCKFDGPVDGAALYKYKGEFVVCRDAQKCIDRTMS